MYVYKYKGIYVDVCVHVRPLLVRNPCPLSAPTGPLASLLGQPASQLPGGERFRAGQPARYLANRQREHFRAG